MFRYPAYHGYPGSPGETVERQVLLAIALLNVSNNPVPAYFGLENLIEQLNERYRVARDIPGHGLPEWPAGRRR